MRPLLALLLLGAGCGRSDPPGLRRVESQAGGYRVVVESVPPAIPLNEPFDLRLRVEPAPPELRVDVDARMPEHFHGMNRAPRVTRAPDGSFLAEGLLFHMPGLWELHIDLRQGPRSERAQLDVILK